MKAFIATLLLFVSLESSWAAINPKASQSSIIFDLPLTYNRSVSRWIQHFQGPGQKWFREWLIRSHVHMPAIQEDLKKSGLPADLAFMAMIESGFSAAATSHKEAVGPWQFIRATGERYGLKQYFWLDERRDFKKSTLAAIKYMKDLYQEFGSWYLVSASYNMGEGALRRQIAKYQTKDFWELSKLNGLPKETMEYVPKILAAMMIAKAPALYGFRDIPKPSALSYDIVFAPGGTDLLKLADHLGITHKSLKDLNAELLLGYIPSRVEGHYIRIPKGAVAMAAKYFLSLGPALAMNEGM